MQQSIGPENLDQLDCQVVFVGLTVLLDGWSNTDGRDGDVLPDVIFWSTDFWVEAEELAVLCRRKKRELRCGIEAN